MFSLFLYYSQIHFKEPIPIYPAVGAELAGFIPGGLGAFDGEADGLSGGRLEAPLHLAVLRA